MRTQNVLQVFTELHVFFIQDKQKEGQMLDFPTGEYVASYWGFEDCSQEGTV